MVEDTYVVHWLFAFAVTQAVEVPIYARALNPRAPLWTRIQLGFLASALTHPVVWFVLPALWKAGIIEVVSGLPGSSTPPRFGLEGALFFAFLESFAVAGEWLYLHLVGLRRPLLWSLCANGTSFCVGITLSTTIGWP